MSDSLEERAISARASVGDATDSINPPVFEPGPPRPPVFVVAALLVAVFGLGGWLAFSSSDEVSIDAAGTDEATDDEDPDGGDTSSSSTTTTTTTTAITPAATEAVTGPMPPVTCPAVEEPVVTTEPDEPAERATTEAAIPEDSYLVFDPPPVGYQAAINELELGSDQEAIPEFTLYGCPGDDPFAEGDLLSATAGPGLTMEDISGGPDAESVEIAGRTVWIDTGSQFPVISWFEDEEAGNVAGLFSQSFNVETLLEIATVRFASGDESWGLELLATGVVPDFGLGVTDKAIIYEQSSNSQGGDGAEFFQVGLKSPDHQESQLLTTWFAKADGQAAEGGVGQTTTETIDYNGLAVTAETRFDSSVALTFERYGRTVSILGLHPEWGKPSIESLLELIDTVRPATDAEVEALRQAS